MNIGEPKRIVIAEPKPEPMELPGKAVPEHVPEAVPQTAPDDEHELIPVGVPGE